MICPSCKRDHVDADNCEHCGFNIKSYRQYADRKLSQQKQQEQSPENAYVHGYKEVKPKKNQLILLLVPVVVVGAGLLLWGGSDEPKESSYNDLTAERLAKLNVNQSNQVVSEEAANNAKPQRRFDQSFNDVSGVALRINESHKARTKIEEARNATVFIQTQWGTLGSGFIINNSCDVITNRHVLEEPVQNTDEFKRRLKEETQALQKEYNDATQAMNNAQQRGDSEEFYRYQKKLRQLQSDAIGLAEKVRRDIKKEQSNDSFSSSSIVYSRINVSLVNGESYEVDSVEVSGEHDLAKFSLGDVGCPFLERGGSDNIIQGEGLFTIGSPSGLSYTVTSGIFSGYRKYNDKTFLQTDAPINPGNSGGPLVTKDGKVVGVNTAILEGTEGIGFAIPISVVESYFSL